MREKDALIENFGNIREKMHDVLNENCSLKLQNESLRRKNYSSDGLNDARRFCGYTDCENSKKLVFTQRDIDNS